MLTATPIPTPTRIQIQTRINANHTRPNLEWYIHFENYRYQILKIPSSQNDTVRELEVRAFASNGFIFKSGHFEDD
jgi:hypothetical protein